LPEGAIDKLPNWIEIQHRDADNQPFAGQGYKIFFAGGSVISGRLDDQGHAHHENVPAQADHVEYEQGGPLPDPAWDPLQQIVAAANSKLG
jgi:type VI secretion system secreted protein VgrG